MPKPIQGIADTRSIIYSLGKIISKHKLERCPIAEYPASQRIDYFNKKADIVGIPYYNDKEILAQQQYLRPLTDSCFEKYSIRPKRLCHTFVNRHMVEYQQFWEMLSGKKVVVISRWANEFKDLIGEKYDAFDIKFVKLIRINRYEEISKILSKMRSIECDIVFISAGVNAVILAQKLAEEQKRIAIDFGKSTIFMIKANRKVRPWTPNHINQQ